MVWTRKFAVMVVAASVVLSQSVAVVSAAPKDSPKTEQAGGKGQSGQTEKGQADKGRPAATEETEAPEADLPECPSDEEPADEQPADEQPADEQPADEEPADEQPADEQPAGEQPADEQPAEEEPADEQPAEEEPADDSEEDAPTCKPAGSSKGKANVNLTGRGKSAEHNPNVGADGQLIPGQAATKTPEEIEAAKAEQIATVKADSRAKAKVERAKGEKGAYLVYVNGERLNLTPIARSGRTLVPFRVLAEYLGAEVSWEPSTFTVTMIKDGHEVVLSIGSNVAYVDGVAVELQVAPELNESRTFVPLRFIAEALGADVDYDAETGAITVITLPGEETTTPPAEGDDTTTPPAEGDDTTTPPAEGDDTTTPPAEGDDTTTPPAEGDDTTAPAEGDDSTTAPAEGDDTTTAPADGTGN